VAALQQQRVVVVADRYAQLTAMKVAIGSTLLTKVGWGEMLPSGRLPGPKR
jgi:hypothetical protein